MSVPCYFKSIKRDPEVQSGISIFRRWQKQNQTTDNLNCHMEWIDNKPCFSENARSIVSSYIPILSIAEEFLDSKVETDIADNDAVLSSIVDEVFKNDIDDMEETDLIDDSLSNSESALELKIDEDKMLTQADIDNYPVKMTQQQLLLLNSLSNRLRWLFDDVTKYGVPIPVIQPHMTALQRMVSASRDIQCKIQSFSKKHPTCDSTTISPYQTSSAASNLELQTAEKERNRLQKQLDGLNDKLTFFSSEYQRITELYLQEKNKNESPVPQENSNEELSKQIEQYKISIEQLMKEREQAQKRLQYLKQQSEELEYALKRLLDTGTVIAPELDAQIQEAISSQSLLDLVDDDIL